MTHTTQDDRRYDEHEAAPEPTSSRRERSAATTVEPLLVRLLGPEPPMQVVLWDGSTFGRPDGVGTLRITSPSALRRILWAPGELGLARAYVAGEIEAEGDMIALVAALRDLRPKNLGASTVGVSLRVARRARALGRPLPPPPEEAKVRGRKHSKARDQQAVRHHYDVGNDFYELVLGEAMTYSCAYFDRPDRSLPEAQAAKHELVCRKLGLHERRGARLLDVGCGWGSMAIHAAKHHGASVVGITISPEQASRATERAAAAGVADRVEIRLQDYRDLAGEAFDAISSIGMFEHVGKQRMREYFEVLGAHLTSGGRLLNHAISSRNGSALSGRSFTGRYVFPDGELLDVGEVVLAMEDAGFEVRDVESLREHYAQTLRHWVANLEAGWEQAVRLVGDARARVWRLYMAGSAVGFEDGGISIHQVLGTLPTADGVSGMPRTRAEWVAPGT